MQNVDVTRYRNYKIKLCFEHFISNWFYQGLHLKLAGVS